MILGRVRRIAGDKEAAIDDIEVIYVVGLAMDIQHAAGSRTLT
jgi:hypothetical protein